MTQSGTVTLLFTDLVNSTELLSRTGDESAHRIFEAHHKLLADAVTASCGQEVKWLGDGLMVAFPSAADAVRCAIAMQQAARSAPGERLSLRVGLHVGEAIKKEADYFGTAVVVAPDRPCPRARCPAIRNEKDRTARDKDDSPALTFFRRSAKLGAKSEAGEFLMARCANRAQCVRGHAEKAVCDNYEAYRAKYAL